MKPIEKIYFAFYKSRKSILYFNQIKELSGLSDSSLNKNLIQLMEFKQVRKNKQRSNTYYELSDTNLIASYFTKFDILKFNNLNYKAKIPLNDFLKEAPHVKSILHFGSSSRGEEKLNSDIDLLIILFKFEDKKLNLLYNKEIKFKIDKIMDKINSQSIYPISCFFINEEEFSNNFSDNLIISAKNTGYPIFGQFEYNRDEYKKNITK